MFNLKEFLTQLLHTKYAAEYQRGVLTLYAAPERVQQLLIILRDHTSLLFKVLSDLTAVDELGCSSTTRFCIVYNLLSTHLNTRLLIKVRIHDNEPVPSAVGAFGAANWLEREVWDMFGIYFTGHPDLRRILTDYTFEGHPLRKDYPLAGFQQVRYSFEEKAIVTEPVELAQEYRHLGSSNPWAGSGHNE